MIISVYEIQALIQLKLSHMRVILFCYPQLRLTILLLAACVMGRAQRIMPVAYDSNKKVNYVRSWDAVIPMADASKITSATGIDSFRMVTQYFDGLGRPIQTVIKKGSKATGSSALDMVSPTVYDEFGRAQFKYLPFVANNTGSNTSISDGFFKLNPFQQDSTFNKGIFSDETYYYGRT